MFWILKISILKIFLKYFHSMILLNVGVCLAFEKNKVNFRFKELKMCFNILINKTKTTKNLTKMFDFNLILLDFCQNVNFYFYE